MGSPLSCILADIYKQYFENTHFEKIFFPFWTWYVDNTFILIDTSLHNIDHILQITNSSDNTIQFIYEIENSGVFLFLDTLVFRTDGGFSASVYRKNFAVSLPPHACSCHLPNQKMVASHFILLLIAPSDPLSFNSEIK